VAFESEISLVVLSELPDPEQIRAFWNANENEVLADVPAENRLWLGRTRAITPEEPRSPGPAGRVFDLLYLRATAPEYTAPLITENLIVEIVDAFKMADHSGLPAADLPVVRAFLADHVGKYLVADG